MAGGPGITGRTALPPDIVWIGSPNFGLPRGTRGQLEPVAIVYHIAQGTLSGIDSWFNRSSSEVSSQYAVGKLGEIHQYVGLKDAAWANGAINNPDLSIQWLRECVENDINPNIRTISIEHEGFTGQMWPEAQYKSSLELTRWLIGEYNIPVDENHLIGHHQIDSVNKSNCPGTGWRRNQMLRDLEDNVNQAEFNEMFKEAWKTVEVTRDSRPPPDKKQVLVELKTTPARITDSCYGHKESPHGGGAPHKHPLAGETGEA